MRLLNLACVIVVLSINVSLGSDIWRTQTDGDIWSMAQTGDLDGDGLEDLLAGSADNLVRALSSVDGTVLWSVPADGDVWCVASFPDIDGDGKTEAAAGTANNEVLIISAGGTKLWSYPTGGDVWCVEEAGDITGDGVPELACGAADDNIYLLNLKTKEKIWSADLKSDVWDIAGGADLNGDGTGDLVAGTAFDEIVALDGTDGSVLWTFSTTGDVWVVGFIEDIDGDNVPEVVAGTASDRMVCVPGSGSSSGPGGQGAQRIWQSLTGSDIRVLQTVFDSNGDGVSDIIAGGLDDMFRFLDGRSGDEFWAVPGAGSIKDAVAAPDIDGDTLPDFIYCTEGSTVEAVSSLDGTVLWTYYAETSATFWSLAQLPDINDDGLFDLAAGSALNIIFGLPSFPVLPPDSVSDFTCVAVEVEGEPGVRLSWITMENTDSVQIAEIQNDAATVIAGLPAETRTYVTAVSGAEDPRTYTVTPFGPGGEGESEACTVTMSPPPVENLACALTDYDSAAITWSLPDPGERELDAVRILVNGVEKAFLSRSSVAYILDSLSPGTYTVEVKTVWALWESPTETCIIEIVEAVAFVRGDANADGAVNLSDVITVLEYLFNQKNVTCLSALEANGDGSFDLSDAVYLLLYLFNSAGRPEAPFPECGTAGSVQCESFPPCE